MCSGCEYKGGGVVLLPRVGLVYRHSFGFCGALIVRLGDMVKINQV